MVILPMVEQGYCMETLYMKSIQGSVGPKPGKEFLCMVAWSKHSHRMNDQGMPDMSRNKEVTNESPITTMGMATKALGTAPYSFMPGFSWEICF